MKTIIFAILSVSLISLGVFSAPVSNSSSSKDPMMDTPTIKNISDALLYAIYLSQHATTLVDYLPVNNTNPSVCFIEPRNVTDNSSAMVHLRKERSWLDSFYNYSYDVSQNQCSDLRGLSQTGEVICIEIMTTMQNIDTLKLKMDQIITDPLAEASADTTGPCWDLTKHQQYWNYNAMHALALFIKTDLTNLQTKLTETK